MNELYFQNGNGSSRASYTKNGAGQIDLTFSGDSHGNGKHCMTIPLEEEGALAIAKGILTTLNQHKDVKWAGDNLQDERVIKIAGRSAQMVVYRGNLQLSKMSKASFELAKSSYLHKDGDRTPYLHLIVRYDSDTGVKYKFSQTMVLQHAVEFCKLLILAGTPSATHSTNM